MREAIQVLNDFRFLPVFPDGFGLLETHFSKHPSLRVLFHGCQMVTPLHLEALYERSPRRGLWLGFFRMATRQIGAVGRPCPEEDEDTEMNLWPSGLSKGYGAKSL